MMKNVLHMAFSCLTYYKKQTAALLTGMGGLFESGKQAALENARAEYGDWPYSVKADADWFQKYKTASVGKGYTVEKTGFETIRKVIDRPFAIHLVCADSGCLDMMGRNLIKGRYPRKENEIAMDLQTLQSLGKPDKPGSRITLDGEAFTLCGIVDAIPEKLPEFLGDVSQVFVRACSKSFKH